MRVLFSIPFFGGTSKAAYSDSHRRVNYLIQTVFSVKLCSKETEHVVVVHVASEQDRLLVNSLQLPISYVVVHDIDPVYLAASSLRSLQNNSSSINENDIIFHTEADQVIQPNYQSHIDSLASDNYLSPHRIEEVPSTRINKLSGNSVPSIILDGRYYLLPNGVHQITTTDRYYTPQNRIDAFGGAFMTRYSALQKVVFVNSIELPVEHASGFNMYNTLQCLKTTNWQDFYVDHLSGYEFNLTRNILLN
jgi:hypothetical protein